MLWVGAISQKCGVICGITCGNLQHIRMLQMTPHFLNASVAEQNISTLGVDHLFANQIVGAIAPPLK